jgi:hypothetical protein
MINTIQSICFTAAVVSVTVLFATFCATTAFYAWCDVYSSWKS